jgi:hAT family C-terminal dimerisation region
MSYPFLSLSLCLSVLPDFFSHTLSLSLGLHLMGDNPRPFPGPRSNQIKESPNIDLEVFLEEKVLVVKKGDFFNVLEWWKANCVKFPILNKFARDILCIPITTVASESAFSAGGRVLDDYRSSLTKDMVELLVCRGDWIRATSNATLHTL